MKFWTRRIQIVANIKKAFLQIGLQPMERDVMQFLWIKDMKKHIKLENILTYCFTGISCGIAVSPFLLGASIKHHLEKEMRRILKDIHINNLIIGVEREEEAYQLYTTSKNILKTISINQWESSSMKINKVFIKDEMKGSQVKVLGLNWNSAKDKITIWAVSFENLEPAASKRQVLAQLASIFDPLGYLISVTMKMGIFMKQLWNQNKDYGNTMEEEHWKIRRQIFEATKGLIDWNQLARWKWTKRTVLLLRHSKDGYATSVYLKTTWLKENHKFILSLRNQESHLRKRYPFQYWRLWCCWLVCTVSSLFRKK